MADPVKEFPAGRALTVRWDADEWQKIEDAVTRFREREGLKTTPTDIIRSGAVRRAEEILGIPTDTDA